MQVTNFGSQWWKFDFHTHTPASCDYGRGDASYKNITPEQWLEMAMKVGLDCVAVTDHNTGEWIDKLKATYAKLQKTNEKPSWFKELIIFPGVEITVGESSSRIHLLGIFDPTTNSQTITSLLGAFGIHSGFGDSESTATSSSFIDVLKKIETAGGIAIPAHIDGAKGFLHKKNTLTPEIKASLQNVIAAEFCNLNSFSESNIELRNMLLKVAKIAGSDAHRHEDLGKYFSWVKMAEPANIHGLRLALMDYEFSVKNQTENPNQIPDIYISDLEIRSMKHCGRNPSKPFIVNFHPHFNALIGGRGTGKSTVIESIRIASRRDMNLDKIAPSINKDLINFKELDRNKGVMLENTEILIGFYRRGEKYRLRWRQDGTGAVLELQNKLEWKEVPQGDIIERFPLSIYSQKQINEMASNPIGLLNVIDANINKTEWEQRWKATRSQFFQLKERQRELTQQLSNEAQLSVQLADIESDLKQYEEKGHAEILQQYQKYSQQLSSLPDEEVFNNFINFISNASNSIGLSDFPEHLFDLSLSDELNIRQIHSETEQKLQSVAKELSNLAKRVEQIQKEYQLNMQQSDWFKKGQTSALNYTTLASEYEKRDSKFSLAMYGEWVEKRNTLQRQAKRLTSIRKELKHNQLQISKSITDLLGMRNELLNRRQKFIHEVLGNNIFVRMQLVAFGDSSTVEEEYRNLLGLQENLFVNSIYDHDSKQGLLLNLIDWEVNQTSQHDLLGIVENIKNKTKELSDGTNKDAHGSFIKRLQNTLENNPSVFDQLEIWWPEDLLKVEYLKDSNTNKFEDIERGSAGQKAAAILAFLLSYGAEPLVIDQPEDDLDNALINDLIVRQIHRNKDKRQLIIATHNPNIVVNGDAELIHVFGFKDGQVQLQEQGGLSEDKVREAVCDIMEGGRAAFAKRYQRINREINHVQYN